MISIFYDKWKNLFLVENGNIQTAECLDEALDLAMRAGRIDEIDISLESLGGVQWKGGYWCSQIGYISSYYGTKHDIFVLHSPTVVDGKLNYRLVGDGISENFSDILAAKQYANGLFIPLSIIM